MEPIGKLVLDRYYEGLKKQPKSIHRTRLQEIIYPYLVYINWQNDTLLDDLDLFYIAANRLWNRVSTYQFIERLEWIKKINSLYPKQAVKTLNK